MITGDYHHTAVAVSKTVGMVKPDSQVVVIDTLQQEATRSWSPDHRNGLPSRSGSQAASSNRVSPLTTQQSSLKGQDPQLGHGATPKTPRRPQLPVTAVEEQGLATAGVEAKKEPFLLASTRRVSFDVPQPMPMHSPFSLPSEAPFPKRQPSEAAHHGRQPIEPAWLDRLSPGTILSPRNRLPPLNIASEEPFERVQSGQTPLGRSLSLSRLPSQFPIPLASLLPDSAIDDSIITSSSPLSPSKRPSLHLSRSFSPASAAISHPRCRVTHDAHPWLLPSTSENPLRGVTCTPAGGRYHMDPHAAWRAMSEGSMQCAVTGTAFEHLLQLPDTSLLEVVMSNAVVFSRMQVCSLLHQVVTATASLCMWCHIMQSLHLP